MVFGLIYRENLRFYVRTRRFQVILPLFAALSVLQPALIIAGVIPKPIDVYSFTQGALSGLTDSVLLVCAVLAGDAVSRDFSREGYFTLTQPVRRSEIMFARYLSALTASLIVVLVSMAIGLGFSEYLYGETVPTVGKMVAIAVLLTASLTAFVMMFSSLSKSAVLSIVTSIIVLIVAMPIVQGIVEFLTNVEPWFLINYAAQVVPDLAQRTYPPHLVTQTIGDRTLYIYSPGVLEGVAIMLGYLVVCATVAWAVYSRRELK